MADITARNLRLDFGDSIDLDSVADEDIDLVMGVLSLSLTMPYLEPYLIRSMKIALPKINDPALAQDVRLFSQQESHHFRNHALLNQRIREAFDSSTARHIQTIESELEADYQRFSREKPLRWNLAYAEGFEAMTCSVALAAAEGGFLDRPDLPGGEIWAWHMAEEIEHRTVAFEVFDYLVGHYAYRLLFGTRAQWHYLSYLFRFSRCMDQALRRPERTRQRPAISASFGRHYLRTWSPRYHPAKVPIPAGVAEALDGFSARLQSA